MQVLKDGLSLFDGWCGNRCEWGHLNRPNCHCPHTPVLMCPDCQHVLRRVDTCKQFFHLVHCCHPHQIQLILKYLNTLESPSIKTNSYFILSIALNSYSNSLMGLLMWNSIVDETIVSLEFLRLDAVEHSIEWFVSYRSVWNSCYVS